MQGNIVREVFQSTHPHGVRPPLAHPRAVEVGFQSTHPHGVRPARRTCVRDIWLVSIHAPTRGATPPRSETCCVSLFQSTHPHGVRQKLAVLLVLLISFNPRTHTGCDLWVVCVNLLGVVSIHAPTRGATKIINNSKFITYVSIHAPTRGATSEYTCVRGQQIVSIHAPTRGAT